MAVAVIDATNRHSRLSEAFGLPENEYGITSFGRVLPGATLIHDHSSGIDIITPGKQLQEGEWLADLITQLRTDHKIILVDLPAVMEDKRSLLLSRATDTALLVVQPDRKDQHANLALIQTMASLGRKPALAVVNQVSASYRNWLSIAVGYCRPGARKAGQFLRSVTTRRNHVDADKMQDQA